MRIRTATELGALIRDRRRRLRLGQQELADRAGVSRQWLIDVEKGKPGAGIGLLLRTLDVLGISIAAAESGAGGAASPRGVDIDAIVAAARRRRR